MTDHTDFGPNRALEAIRRLCLLGGALAAAWCAVKPTDALFRVRDVDFAKLQKQDARRMRSDIRMMSRVSGMAIDPNDPTINTATTLTPEQYFARKTQDRLIEVSGNQWTEFYNGVQQTLAGKSKTFARNVSVGYGSYFLYFPTDAAPLHELTNRLGDAKPFTYVAVRDGGGVKYMEVLFQRPQSAQHDAPNWLFYPLRGQSGWWFIVGLLAYAGIPWHRKRPEELRYSTARAMVGPDMLGMVMAVFFVTLPILVITGNAVGSEPLDVFGFRTGWWPLTLVMWLLACGGFVTVFVALWYASFSLVLTPDGIRRRTLFGADECAFADMTAIEPARWAWPTWLRIVAILIGMLNWRLLGAVLIGSSQEAYGIAIRMKDGRTVKLWMTHLPGFERIFHAMRKAGVPLDPELAKIVDEDLASPAPAAQPGRGGKLAAAILLALAVAGALTWQFWPEKSRPVKREPTYSYEALAQCRALLNEMQKIVNRMKQVPGTAEFDELMKQHEALEKRYDAILPTEED
ncbi:MAG: hypothetical protein N2689_05685 [Verrucomicrobiae bacterium]|nr:hypothetical protein [Verrucomicrobiae bacterium]